MNGATGVQQQQAVCLAACADVLLHISMEQAQLSILWSLNTHTHARCLKWFCELGA